jgi:hypothetical protein
MRRKRFAYRNAFPLAKVDRACRMACVATVHGNTRAGMFIRGATGRSRCRTRAGVGADRRFGRVDPGLDQLILGVVMRARHLPPSWPAGSGCAKRIRRRSLLYAFADTSWWRLLNDLLDVVDDG